MKSYSRLGIATFLTAALSFAGMSVGHAMEFRPPDRGAPRSAADGGTRGCTVQESGQKTLKALTPGQALPLTLSSHPTFFWYMPETRAESVTFVLNDRYENTVYSVTLDNPNQAGIMSMSLPEEERYALKTGENYHWYVFLTCNANDPTGDVFVDGWVQRLDESDPLAQQLLSPGGNADLTRFAEAGIWHEALAGLVQKRQNAPNDQELAASWQEFLESVDLGQLAQEPFLR
ncbi:DUF928 domain-containing protein [Spirulina subsalsa]|uniref:DUF928 domain-containing protein n=1 Tax=Spirulina subsalsa TaxID=54311 RepID=UPI0002DED686|nr:DUF928 domain-containing protein [Spirulina subsalsa]